MREASRVPQRATSLFGALAGFGLLCFGIYDGATSREAVLEGARHDALNRAVLVAEHTARSLDTVDIVLRTFAATLPSVSERTAPPDARRRLEDLLVELPQVRSFRIVSPDGEVLVTAGPTDGLPLELAGQDYLGRHRDDPPARLTIGEPRTHATGWTIPVSQRIKRPDGGFGGIVIANLEGGYFKSLYETAAGPGTTALALWRGDGALLVRVPGSMDALGRVLMPPHDMPRLAGPASVGEGVSPVDGRTRLVGFGPVPGVDMAVTVAIDRTELLAEWQAGTLRHAGVLGFILLLLAGGLWVLRRQIRNAQEATAQRVAVVEGALHGYFFLPALRNAKGELVDFVIGDMNRRAEQMLCRPRAAWIGERLCDVLPSVRDGLFERYAAVLETREALEMEFRVRTSELRPEWLRIQVQPLDDGIVIAARDISVDKAAALARESAEQKLSDIAETVPGMVYQFAIHPDGRREFVFVSQGVRDLYGLEPAQAEGDAATLTSFVIEEDANEMGESVELSYRTLQPWRADFRIVRDGRIRWLRAQSRPQSQPSGSVIWNGVVIDVTEERQAQQQVVAAREEAEQANRAKSYFLANMSHELRTPLNAVIGFSEALQHGLGGSLTARQDEYLEHIQSAGHHLLGIIDDVLDLSKIEAGQAELVETVFSLEEVADSAVALVSGKAAIKGIELDAADLAGLPPVRGDARRIKQVLLNLLSNAVKYTPQKGLVRLSAALQPDGWLRISVADSGPGMTAEEVAVARSPFGQVGDSFVRGEGGTGLGLPVSEQLLAQHGGRLEIESRRGWGTRVSAFLPPARIVRMRAGAPALTLIEPDGPADLDDARAEDRFAST